MDYINRLLLRLLDSQDLITRWWNTPNKEFNNCTPLQAFNDNNDVVFSYVERQFK